MANNRMNDVIWKYDANNSLVLSSEEICVLSALLKRDFIAGIDVSFLEEKPCLIEQVYRQTLSNLERRGVVKYFLKKKLQIQHQAKMTIDAISKPSEILLISKYDESRNRSLLYLIRVDGWYVAFRFSERRNAYVFNYWSEEQIKDNMQEGWHDAISNISPISNDEERVAFSAFSEAKRLISMKKSKDASQVLLKNGISKARVQQVMTILSGRHQICVVKRYKKVNYNLKLMGQILHAKLDACDVSITASGTDVCMHFLDQSEG